MTTSMTINVAGTSKLAFASGSGPLNAKVIVQAVRPSTNQQFALYEEFDVIWTGNLGNTLSIISTKRAIGYISGSFRMLPSKWFYDSTNGTITLESYRNGIGFSVPMCYTIIGTATYATTTTDTNTPSGTEITAVNFTINENSNVGIGTSTPAYTLDVVGTTRVSSNVYIGSTQAGVPTIGTIGGTGDKLILFQGTGSLHPYSLGINSSTLWYSVPTGTIHKWYMGGSASMTLSNNSLGIGTTTPSYTLDVSGTIRGNQLLVGNNGTSNAIYFGGVSGDATTSNTFIMERLYDPTNDSNVASDYSELLLAKYNDTSTGAGPDRIRHIAAAHKWQVYTSVYAGDTNTNLADSNFLTAMYIDSNANVGIGLSNLTTTAYKLDVNGLIRSRGNGIIYTAYIGDCGYGTAFAGLQHSNLSLGVGSYGVGQTSAGLTILNAANAQYIAFRNNNVDQGAWTTTGLGIGTTSPSYKLDVVGYGMRIQGGTGATPTILYLNSTGASTTTSQIQFVNSGHFITCTDSNLYNSIPNVGGGQHNLYYSSGAHNFKGTTYFIDSVGIGNSNPVYKLDVTGTARVSGNVANTPDITMGSMLIKSYNKSLTATALDFTNICTLSSTNGACSFQLNVVHNESSSGESKTYMASVLFLGGNTTYYRLNPITSTGVYLGQDWTVEINQSNVTTTLRLVRISGTTSTANFTCILQVYQSQTNPVTITDSTTTGSSATNSGLWANTQITQVNSNVGIGTEAPAYKLDVNGTARVANILYMNNQVQNCVIDLFGASPSTTKTDYFGFGINSSVLRYQVDGTGSDHVIFANTTELMRIKGTGNVGIGTNSPSYTLHVSGTIYSSSDIIAFSDKRLKSNINIIDSALTKIHKMSGYTFNVEQDDKLHTGLIAQEVVEVLPEAVYQEKKQDGTDGYYSVAYGNMAGIFVEAIKEMDNKYSRVVSDLQSQVTKLQNEIVCLKKELSL